jgi:serine/threonine-protein kinase
MPLAAAPMAAPAPTAEPPIPAEVKTPPESTAAAPPAAAEAGTAVPAPDKAPVAAAPPKARKATTKAAPVAPAAAEPVLAQGVVHIAISPWGQVEVNGAPVGTTPPLSRLELPQGTHTITIRNEDFPPYTQRVQVDPERPATLKHRFGS